MPGWSIDRDDAIREVAEVENALFDGYPINPVQGSKRLGCIRVAAHRLGKDDQSMRRRIGRPDAPGAIARRYGIEVDWGMYRVAQNNAAVPTIPEPAPRLGGTAIDRKIVALEDEVRRLTSALKEAHRQSLDDDAVRQILGVFADTPVSPPSWVTDAPKVRRGETTQEVPVTIWSDWHLGEVVSREEVSGANEYNIQVAERRVKRLVDSTINLCLNYHKAKYPGVVVNLLGDFVSGGLHPELTKTDEEESIPATLRARDLLVAALTRMADTFGRVYCPCAAGNHGRNTAKPEFKRYVYQNWDWLLYQLLIRHFERDKRIRFDVRPSNDVHYRVYGQRYLAVHGDMLGVKGGDGIIGAIGPITRGEVKKSRQSAAVDLDYDMLLMGHWHQPLWLPRAIVANTLKGFDEYARLQLGAVPTEPSQPLWFVHPSRGITSRWDVKVDDPKVVSTEWVSWAHDMAA